MASHWGQISRCQTDVNVCKEMQCNKTFILKFSKQWLIIMTFAQHIEDHVHVDFKIKLKHVSTYKPAASECVCVPWCRPPPLVFPGCVWVCCLLTAAARSPHLHSSSVGCHPPHCLALCTPGTVLQLHTHKKTRLSYTNHDKQTVRPGRGYNFKHSFITFFLLFTRGFDKEAPYQKNCVHIAKSISMKKHWHIFSFILSLPVSLTAVSMTHVCAPAPAAFPERPGVCRCVP